MDKEDNTIGKAMDPNPDQDGEPNVSENDPVRFCPSSASPTPEHPADHDCAAKPDVDNELSNPNQEEEEDNSQQQIANKDDVASLQEPNPKPLEVTVDSAESYDDNEEQQQSAEVGADVIDMSNLPWWYPRFRGKPVFYGTKEALGWACTAVAQAGVLIGTGAFILPAISKLAKEEAGCETEAPSGEDLPDCEGTVYGIKPSSLLTVMSTCIGLVSAFIIPPVGAIVDYTSHRRLIGRCLSVCYSILILSLVFLNDDSWFAICLVLLVVLAIGLAISMLFNAYLPELTDDENRLNEFSKTFTVLIFTTMVLYLILVMSIALGLGVADDDVALARIAILVAFVLSAILYYLSWGLLFDERPASNVLPEGQTLWGAGFRKVYRTSIQIWNNYRALKWFYISICFGDAAIQSLSVVAITFVTDQLELASQEVGAAALLLLLGSIPGAIVGALANAKLNPIRSSALSVLGMTVGTVVGAVLLKGPGQQTLTYFFSFLWGAGTGWKYTSDRVLAAGIIPPGQDAELMGFYAFCGQVFAWAPSLVFTIMNEAGVSQRIGLASLAVLFVGAFLCYVMMGDYAAAVGAANRLRVDTIPSMAQQPSPKAGKDAQEDNAMPTEEEGASP